MSQDDVLFGYRLQLFDLAGRVGVAAACRTFGVHRSTCSSPCSARNGSSPSRSVIPGSVGSGSPPDDGDRAGAGSSSRRTGSGAVCAGTVSTPAPSASRRSPASGHPHEPPAEPPPEPHIEVNGPGEPVGSDCFSVGRLRGTEGAIWQLTALDLRSSFAWARPVVCRRGNPTPEQSSKLARRVAQELRAAGWRLERLLCDDGQDFRGRAFRATVERLGARVTHIHAGRPQRNGQVEARHKTILEGCWRPAFARSLYPTHTGLRRELERYLAYHNFDRVHHGRLRRGLIPAEIVDGARKMEAR